MFEPIEQLQALRYRCLLIRELCRQGNGFAVGAAYFRDGGLLAWRTSRLIGGWLQGHPNDQFHPKTSVVSRLALRCHAALTGLIYFGERRRTHWLHGQLAQVGKACADIRAVTSSVAINDLLGRRQPEIAALQRMTAAVAAVAGSRSRAPMVAATGRGEDPWPFLSI